MSGELAAEKIMSRVTTWQTSRVPTGPIQRVIERQNLNNRMHNRRFTRLTTAFSEKWENHEAMFALYDCWYNWRRPHMGLKRKDAPKSTPVMAQGLASVPWTIERLLTEFAAMAA